MTLHNDTYETLMTFQRETDALGQIAGRLEWDREAIMPRGANGQRSEECSAIEGILHARRSDPGIADWLEGAQATTPVQAAQLRLIRRAFDRATKVPAPMAMALRLIWWYATLA